MTGGNAGARRENLRVKSELIGFGIGDEVGAGFAAVFAGLADDRALPRDDARITAEPVALSRDLRKEQRRRDERRYSVGSRADLTAQPHHSLAALQRND